MSYPQQQGPYGQQYGGYQQPGQYGGGPPPKSNATAIALVIVLVAVLAGVGITGFVAPGFFIGDDKESADGGGTGGGGTGAGSGSEVDQFAGELVSAANTQDKAALSGFKCADATGGVDAAIDAIDQTDGAELSDTQEVAEDEYNLVISISYQGSSAPFSATVTKAENGWCWQDFAEGKGGGSGGGAGSDSDSDSDGGPPASGPSDSDGGGGGGSDGTAGAQTYAEEFLTAVNAKDEATAEGMICSDTPSNSLVSFVIKKNPRLEIAGVEDAGSHFVDFEVGGTVDGGPVTTGSVSVRITGGGSPCIFTFIAG